MSYSRHAGAKQAVGLLEEDLRSFTEEHQQQEGSHNSPQLYLCQEEPPARSLGSTFVFPVTISQALDLLISCFSRAVHVKMNVKRK